jgi:hypothetical protein
MSLAGGAPDINWVNCNMYCPGNPSDNCGRYGTLNLYTSNTRYVAPALVATAGAFEYVGFQMDGVNGTRALDAQAYAQPDMTNEICATLYIGYT